MKKSNIILVVLFGIFLSIIIALQLQVKSYVKNIEDIEIEYPDISELHIESGWYIELHYDSIPKLTFNNDSLPQFVKAQNNKLIIHKINFDNEERGFIKISSPDVNKIDIYGNSTIYYYNDSVDSLSLNLFDKSKIIISPEEIDDSINIVEQQAGYIDYINFCASNKSHLNIYSGVNFMKGSLNDSSYLYLDENVNDLRLKKSIESRITSW